MSSPGPLFLAMGGPMGVAIGRTRFRSVRRFFLDGAGGKLRQGLAPFGRRGNRIVHSPTLNYPRSDSALIYPSFYESFTNHIESLFRQSGCVRANYMENLGIEYNAASRVNHILDDVPYFIIKIRLGGTWIYRPRCICEDTYYVRCCILPMASEQRALPPFCL